MSLPKTKDTSCYIDRPFNIRPFCFWAFIVLLTVVVCLWSRYVGAWIVAVFFVFLVITFIILRHLKIRDAVLIFLGSSRIFFLVTIVLCFTVVVVFTLTNAAYTTQKSFTGAGELTGTIEYFNIREDGSGYFALSAVRFNDERVSGRVQVYFENITEEQAEQIISTYRISFAARINAAAASDYNINNRIKYTANLRSGKITQLGKDMQLRHIVTRYSKDFLGKVLEGQNLELMHAMLFGDASILDDEVSENFRATGIVHVISVSGLHVVLIAGLLMAGLKVCRVVDRKKQFPIIAVVLLFYCYLCGFKFPIIRASIMFLVYLFNRIYLRSNDSLSSICAAAIAILVMFPYSLLSVSFQLSFACVLGIAFFQQPFSKFFARVIPRPKWIADAVSMYFAVTVFSLPLLIEYFGCVATLGLFANVFLMPLLTLCFVTCVVTLLTFITYPLLYVVSILLNWIVSAVFAIGRLPFALAFVEGSGYFFILYLVGMIFLTRYIFLRRKYKYAIAAVLISIYLISLMLV